MARSKAWNIVDEELLDAISKYSEIKTTFGYNEQAIFIDLIIKLNLCRVYVRI